ncbi:MAG: SPFH domain-containing protein [Ardenticatenia bacterium]|nr:SPFH domain-containing protein [Ardenticatenia bacterium]
MAILDVIEWFDPSGRELVHRVPEQGSGEFRLGSQLIVRESQAAVFFRDGKALDTFTAGRHTLTTANLPLLTRLISVPFGGNSPFRAEVVFVNLKQFTDMKWGTSQPISLRDTDLGMVQLRAFGRYAIQVRDPQHFVNAVVGSQGLYETRDIEGYLRSMIVSRFTDLLGEMSTGLLELPRRFDELNAAMRAKLHDDFGALGLSLRGFFLESISPTEATQRAIDERAAMGAIGDMRAYLQFKAARALGDVARSGGGGEGAGEATSMGFGLGAGAGLGAMMAQLLAQSFGQGGLPHASAQPEGAGETGTPPQTVEQAFTALEMLVQQQLAVPQAERDEILRQLAALEVELSKPEGDLAAIKNLRKAITERWPWLVEALEHVFRQPPVERAMAAAARRFLQE